MRCSTELKLMELASPHGYQALCYANPSSNNYYTKSNTSYHGYFNVAISIANHSKPIFPTQIHLPLHRPNHHLPPPPLPLPLPPPKKWKSTTTTTTTTSDVLRLMDGLGLPIPIDIYTSLLKECITTRDPAGALDLIAHINRSGLRPGLLFFNRILLMYVSCGLVDNARHVFDKMPTKDCNSWAAMIAGYMDNDNYEEVINLFVEMRCSLQYHQINADMLGFPESWIIVCILKACVQTMNLGLGRQIHGWLSKIGYSKDLFLSSSLINLYGKFGCLEGVDSVFDHMACRNTVVWTAKIVNKCREEQYDEVLNVFKEMGREGVKKNGFTFSSVLRACGKMKDDGLCGRQVHANAIKLGLESNDFVQCGLVDMYAKCGLLKHARVVFEMDGEERNAACWNAMLMGYIQHGCCIEAIKIVYAMKSSGLQPQESLLNEVRCTCGSGFLEN
ncbi:pentatricopeptide repeat-containing protein At1g31790-like [Camellia sinensis]|uniref:pentatricopeptide repeat-containing protein At1g31790-like n=1 Tax=Camellia sinensis TaxID=4442 RepID=UPI001035EE3D|nr:pentatricopeptide repeat-containing protein At1g31790-like [Camellia sinensis]XP_028094788.1 pentatricopeptide repeat-containing protein At1g31790-like [Camellia sinensis]